MGLLDNVPIGDRGDRPDDDDADNRTYCLRRTGPDASGWNTRADADEDMSEPMGQNRFLINEA